MALQHYRYYGETKWMGMSGMALLALVNQLGSNKKVTITGIEIYNQTFVGTMVTADTQSAFPTAIKISNVTNLGGGTSLDPVKLDTDASDFPSTVQVKKGSVYTTTGSLYASLPFCKSLLQSAFLGFKITGDKNFSQSNVWRSSLNSANEMIIIRAGEKLAVYANTPNASLPLLVEAQVVVNGSPNRTYNFSYFTNFTVASEAIFGIDNNSGSGLVVTLSNISVSEIGTYDTPYFQIVPVGTIDAAAYDDPDKSLSVVKTDSTHQDLDPDEIRLFTNVYLLPFGVPQSYLAEASAGSPKGFNYLNTKDFIGPVYGCFFPEAVASKTAGTTLLPSTLGSHLSSSLSRIKGFQSPIVIREGEGIAIVSGAETATAATAVGTSGWGAYDFALNFSVQTATIPTITLSGLVIGSRYRVDKYPSGVLVQEGTAASTEIAFLYPFEDFPLTIRIRVRKSSGAVKYQPYEVLANLTSADIIIPISQISDTIAD